MRLLSIAVLALICAGCTSLPTGEVTFTPSPRLSTTQAEIAAWRADPARAKELAAAVAKADRILVAGLVIPRKEGEWIFYYACPDEGARLRPESDERHVCPTCKKVYTDERTQAAYRTLLYNRLDDQLGDLGLAYALTGDAKYLTPTRDAFFELARLYPTFTRHDRWGRTGLMAAVGGRRYAQHLDEATGAIALAKAYDLIATGLSAEERETIAGFLASIVNEIRRWQFAIEAINNHQTWFNAAYANVGVAIGDSELLNAAIHEEGRGLLWQLDHSVTAEGLWYEGTMAYHFYALSAIVSTLEAARQVGWTFAGNERLKSLWLGPLSMAYPDGTFPVINDSDPGNLRGRVGFYRFARDYFDEPAFGDFDQPRALPSKVLAGAGLVALRRAGATLFVDYGLHGGHHGHPDKLNLMLYAFGREVALDPGRLTYSVPEYETWARTTVAHNTVVIDGQNQQPDEGRLLWFNTNGERDACLVESTGAYPGWTLRRLLVLTDRYLLDIYQVNGDRDATTDWLLHARGDLQQTGEALPDGALGNANGYQHLTGLRAQGQATRFVFAQPGDASLTVDCWPAADAFTGLGIGYRLNDRVPFLLRRAKGKTATFVTLYGVGREAVTLRSAAVEGSAVSLDLAVGEEELKLRADLSPESPSFSAESGRR